MGLPKAIRLDNEGKLRSAIFTSWCEEKGIERKFIQPGKPQKNDFIERFNRTYRHEVLNAHIFESLEQACEITEEWIHSYNLDRPHAALGKLSPIHYRQQAEKSALAVSTFQGVLQNQGALGRMAFVKALTASLEITFWIGRSSIALKKPRLSGAVGEALYPCQAT